MKVLNPNLRPSRAVRGRIVLPSRWRVYRPLLRYYHLASKIRTAKVRTVLVIPFMDILLTTHKYHHYVVATTSEGGPLGLNHPFVELFDCQASENSDRRLERPYRCRGHRITPWGIRMGQWHNIRAPRVTVAGAIAVVVGKWLRSALKAAAAKCAAQTRLRGQGVINNVN